ncbi:MAG: hypothetical protein QGI45_03820 [Myxococcota bacterium]|jgi:hypothetical protein|nr:hypothetical protein [Myxococcota bacterium]
MKNADNDYKFDTRLQERHLRQGVISSSDLEQHLEALPDMTEESESLGLDVDLNIESPEAQANEAEAPASGPVLVSAVEPEAQ